MDVSVIFADLSSLEASLRLPSGFIANLINEDDWSFVIKSQAVIEAAVTHLLSRLTDPRLHNIYRRLSLVGTSTSKLAVAEALGALDDSTRSLIRRFADLRNNLVHDVGQLSFSIDSYFKGLNPTDRHSLCKLIAKVVADSEEPEFVELASQSLNTIPKETLALSVFAILARSLFKLDPKEYDKAAANARESADSAALFAILALVIANAAKKSSG